jgi:hypothetical protein
MNRQGVVYKVYACCTLCLEKENNIEHHNKVVPPHHSTCFVNKLAIAPHENKVTNEGFLVLNIFVQPPYNFQHWNHTSQLKNNLQIIQILIVGFYSFMNREAS